MRASELPSCEVLGPLDPAFAKPRTVALLERAENRHLLDHVAMDAFGAHVFPGDLLAYPPAGFLQDLNRQIQDGNPIHLWVNLPVCEQRCHFCQFPVVTARDAGHRGGVLQRGLDANLREVRLWLEAVPALGQVPIGAFSLLGGTPTLLSDEQLEALLYFYREHFRFRADTSIRIEGTASSFTRDRLEQLRHQGIGTVSAGIQSFDDAVLAAAHCVHTAADAIRYLEQARLRFEVDLDLMYGMAGQDVRGFTHHGRLKKAARIFRDSGYRIHLDLGYEIKSDKGRFFAPHEDGLPDWVHRIRTLPEPFGQYSNELVAGSLRDLAQPQAAEPDPEEAVAHYAREIANRLVRTFVALNLRILIVENGTLPENVYFSTALHRAIEVYGRWTRAGKYVLWRDHDLMWTSEPGSQKYGQHPYPRVPKLQASPFITHVVLSQADRDLAKAWSPEAELEILPNHFWNRMASDPARPEQASARAFRSAHGIPAGAILIARYTRIIPQKRIDRDLDLLAFLHQFARDHPEDPGLYLCIAGDEHEAAEESQRLRARVRALQLEASVVFTGELEPISQAHASSTGRSVYDLIVASDLCSFLTSQDYESFGNPVAEAIMLHRPYLSSSYDRYRPCYADKGYRGLVFPVAQGQDGPMDLGFAAECSIVIPVFNEARNLEQVFQDLGRQRRGDSPRKHPFELILVDNHSTDQTRRIMAEASRRDLGYGLTCLQEPRQGVAHARKAGMDLAVARSLERDRRCGLQRPFYLLSADADCRLEEDWVDGLVEQLEATGAALAVSHYYYAEADFPDQPRLFQVLDRIVRARACAWALMGGFPDGKGFAVTRDKYQEVGGIELFYQVRDGEFVCHLSDDWDFGIKLRASGEELVFAPRSRVRINPRRIQEGLDDMLEGVAYGRNGIITMNDYRPLQPSVRADLSAAQAGRLFANAIKDFTPKNLILPLLLTPELLKRQPVLAFLTPSLCARLAARIEAIKAQMQIKSFLPIHRYKTPSSWATAGARKLRSTENFSVAPGSRR